MRTAAIVLLLAACGKSKSHYERLDHEAAKGVFDEVVVEAPPGLSGLAADDHDVLWTVPERDRVLVEVHLDGRTATTKSHPLAGVPDGVDTEGLAWLGPGRFAIATEGQHEATAGVLFVEARGDGFVVTGARELRDADLGVKLTVNHGAEGACGSGDDVLLAIETVGKLADGTRYAPIVRLRGDKLTVQKLRLTSDTGKISSLDCTIAADGTASVWAIERHYGVSRILRFTSPASPFGATELTPVIARDLGPILNDSLNLEGLVQLHDGRLIAVVDNQGATVDGPNELLVFAKDAVR